MRVLRSALAVVGAFGLLAMAAVGLAATANASPAPGVCHETKSSNGHTVTAQCNLDGTGYYEFRVGGYFCGTSSCEWVYGPKVQNFQTSSVTSGGQDAKIRVQEYCCVA